MSNTEKPTLSHSQKMAAEEAKHHKMTRYYVAGTILLLVISLAAVVWNSGFFQKNATAATVDGTDYSVAELGYFYYNKKTEAAYYANYGASSYKNSVADDKQMYNETQTYRDYFLESALADLKSTHVLVKSANENGFVVDDATMAAEVQKAMDSVKAEASYYGLSSVDAYLKAYVNQYMTLDIYEDLLRDQVTAYSYVTKMGDDMAVSDAEIDSYYAENTDALDTYTLDYMVIQATRPTAAEGETLTDEELAAGLEENRVAAEADANAILAALESGEDFDALGEKYEVFGAYQNAVFTGDKLNTTFADWMIEDGRQAGDLTVQHYEAADRHVYYVVRFQDRQQDNTPTADIRHIFISAGAAPTQEEYDEAKTKAEDLLAQWKDGDATAESFGELATLYSADTSSASNGGYLANVSASSGYVSTFTDWCMDESRTAGDTGLVLNEGSSLKGWHIMYYEAEKPALWKVLAESALLSDSLNDWYDSIMEGMDAQLESGAKHIG